MSLVATTSTLPPPPPPIDLTALRAAALKSKKRKLEAARAAARAQDAEMEEGEIEEQPDPEPEPDPTPAPAALAKPVPVPRHVPSPPPLPPLPPPPPPPEQPPPDAFSQSVPPPPLSTSSDSPAFPSSPEQLLAIREEAKHIIGELLSYGVPPEYLIGVGVSKDIVAIAFHELGFRLPPHLAFLAPPPPPHYVYPSEAYPLRPQPHPSLDRDSSLSPPPSPPHPGDVPGSSSSSSSDRPGLASHNAVMEEREARTRTQLLERKAALASRNSEQAQLLQDELERTLFGSFSAPTVPTVPTVVKAESLDDYGEDDEGEDVPPEAGEDDTKAVAAVSSLREAVDEADEVVYVPSGGPFTKKTTSGNHTPTPIPTPRSARPVAADFVAPSRYDDDAQLVIDLSDSDDESEEESEADQPREMVVAPKRHVVPSPPITARTLTAVPVIPAPIRRDSSTTENSGDEAKKRLEEKEQEIKNIMSRIARMEERKRKSTATHSGALHPVLRVATSAPRGTPASLSTPNSPASSRLPSPVPESSQIAAAKEHVDLLVRERKELLEENGELEVPAEETEDKMETDEQVESEPLKTHTSTPFDDMAADAPTTPFTELSIPPALVPPVGKRFVEYESPFEHFPLSRSLQPLPPVARPSPSSRISLPTNHDDDAALRSWVAHNRGVDASKRLCKCDTEGGTCSDKACKSNHASGYRIDDTDIASYVLATSGMGSGEKREVFAKGLALALAQQPRPLTLDHARTAAFDFWQESHPVGHHSLATQ